MLEAGKSKIKGLADLVFSVSSLLGSQTVVSLYPCRERKRKPSVFLLVKAVISLWGLHLHEIFTS